jgi:HK97 family phage portal protein
MTVLETAGGKLVTASGRTSSLSRPSVPLGAYGSYGAGNVGLTGGLTVSYAQLYRTQPWVAVNTNKLSRQISRLPLKVYTRDSQNNRQEVSTGSLPDVLRTPWNRGSAFSLKQAISFPTTLHGNSVLGKLRQRRGGPVTGFLPLDWRFLLPHLDERGGVLFWETTQTGKSKFLDPADVIHFAWAAPDGDLGVSPLQQLGTTIKLEDAAQRYATGSFDNAVRPSGALVADKDAKLKPEEINELRAQIEQTHGGIDNAFRMLLLGGGMDWKPFSQTAKEAELIESRKLNREEVAAVYDMPPPMIGDLEKATFSNITEQHKMLFTTVLGPWLVFIQETLQAQLIDSEPAFEGHFVEFDLNEQLKGDPEKRIPAITKGIEAGLYTINDGRKMEGLPPHDHPWADLPLIQSNNLKPLGAEDDGDKEAGTDAETVASHVGRARDRVLTRAGAGAASGDLFDRARFERELADDSGDEEAASALGTTIENGLIQADGDLDQIKQFFSALGA